MNALFKKMYDKNFRTKLTENPKQYLQEIYDARADADVKYVVITCTKDITYIPMPSANNILGVKQLADISAAGTVSTASSSGTVGTFTFTLSSAGSLGTAGSVNVNVSNDIRN